MCPNMCVSVQKCTFPERRCAVFSVQHAAAPEVGASFEGLRDRLHQPNHCTEYTTQYTLFNIHYTTCTSLHSEDLHSKHIRQLHSVNWEGSRDLVGLVHLEIRTITNPCTGSNLQTEELMQ